MPAQLRLEGSGFQALSLALERFGENVSNAEPIFDEIADDFAAHQEANFRSSGGLHGGWMPLSPRYAAWKSLRYPGAPILTLTGRLRATMTQRPLGVERITSRSMEIGTDVPYAKYHQQGTRRMPQRKIINKPTRGELKTYGSILHRYAFEGVA